MFGISLKRQPARQTQPVIILKPACHYSKEQFKTLLLRDVMAAIKAHDTLTADLSLAEYRAVCAMTYADYAYYCHQRAGNAALAAPAAQQLTLF